MYFRSFIVASLLASFVAGLSVPGLPDCAGGCVKNLGGCQRLSVKCICTNTPWLDHLACCVSKTCDKADQNKTIQFANAICQDQAGVSNLPQTATCASNSTTSMTSSGTMTTKGGSQASASSATGATTTGTGGAMGRMDETHLGMILAGLMAAL